MIKRKFRILRIWYYGKLRYAKKYKRWMNGNLIRQLGVLTAQYHPEYMRKYGNESYIEAMKLFSKTAPEDD